MDLFRSYLQERSQYVHFNDISSDRINLVCGVPQGSILGPLLVSLYINDMPSILCSTYHLSDDVQLYRSCKLVDVSDCVESCMCVLKDLM